jgi:hypothetical protein
MTGRVPELAAALRSRAAAIFHRESCAMPAEEPPPALDRSHSRIGLQSPVAAVDATPEPHSDDDGHDDAGDDADDVDDLQLQLELLTTHFAEQALAIEGLDARAEPPAVHAALIGELALVKERVRETRTRIAARTADQIRSARHLETRARRVEEKNRLAGERAAQILGLELAIARADASIIAHEVGLAEEMACLAARERQLASCAHDRGLTAADPAALAGARIERLRARIRQIRLHASKCRALDAPLAGAEGIPVDLNAALDAWSRELDALAACTQDPHAPLPRGVALRLDDQTLRAQLASRVRLLEALAELRVEETQALQLLEETASGVPRRAPSHVAVTRIRLQLDEAERAWLLEALQAVEQEQEVQLLAASEEATGARGNALTRAILAWRRCEEKLEAAASLARAAQTELAESRAMLMRESAQADADARHIATRIRHRRSTLHNHKRRAERARSRLVLTRQRSRSLASKLLRARRAVDHVCAERAAPAAARVLVALSALAEVADEAATVVGGLHAAHEHCSRAIAVNEAALRDLSDRQRAAAHPHATEGQWDRARIELEVAALADELERWKARHAALEKRVEAQARLLYSLEAVHRDEAVAALRADVEEARRSAAASLQRALSLSPDLPLRDRTE